MRRLDKLEDARGTLSERFEAASPGDALDFLPAEANLKPIPARRQGERRVGLRRYLSVNVAFTINEAIVGEGVLNDISDTGLKVMTETPVKRGALAECRLGDLGVYRGVVVRTFPSGFAIRYRLFPDEIEALNTAVSDHFRGVSHAARRPDRRLIPDRRADVRYLCEPARLWGFDGRNREIDVEVVNVSASGVLVKTGHPLAIGERVTLAARAGYVVRASEGGYAVKWV